MKYSFIVNPNSRSKKGRKIWEQVEAELKRREISYSLYMTERRKNASGIAADLTASVAGTEKEASHTIVVVGGDGTVNEVLNGLEHPEQVILGYIPTGSSNDFARSLRLPTDPIKALDLILNPTEIRRMDAGVLAYQEKQRKFAVSTGIGFDAIVCHQASVSKLKAFLNKFGLGKLTYAGIALDRLIKDETVQTSVCLDGGAEQIFEQTYFAAVMNHPYEGGGFKFCPEADPQDGQLDVIVVSGLSRMQVILLLPLAFFGRHTWHRSVSIFRCKSVKIRTSRALAVHTDGEAVFLKKSMEAYVLPGYVRVITG